MRFSTITTVVSILVPVLGLTSVNVVAQHRDRATEGQDAGPRHSAQLFDEHDLMFLHHMIIHHEQAVVMSALVPTRSNRDEFVRFTGYVARAQAAEIALMQSYLDLATERGQNVPAHTPAGDPPMSGMLSSQQMDELAAASGPEFERLWLEGMIFHHQGAIDMAHAQQQNQLDNARRPFGIAVLVEDILVEQRAEIVKMRDWLIEWGLVRILGSTEFDAA